MTRISVIIPTFNRAHYLSQAIEAILSQSRKIDEIIVVDDGSSDKTKEVVQKSHPGITYIYQKNSGKSAALNRGLMSCTGDYIWICDDDDLAEPTAAEILAGALDKNEDVASAFGRLKRFNQDPVTEKMSVIDCGYWPNLEDKTILIALLQDCFIFQNATFVRKKAYDAVGQFRTDLVRSQDYEMITRLAIAFQGVYVPQTVFMQRDHQGERGSSKDRFNVSQQLEKWVKYDATFFKEIMPKIPLELLVPPDFTDNSIRHRAAILQRAAIYARKKIWDCALTDVKFALTLSRLPLTSSEVRICSDFLLSKHGCHEIAMDRCISRELRLIRKQSETGRDIAFSVSRGLIWRIKEAVHCGYQSIAFKFARAYVEINGLKGIIFEGNIRLSEFIKRLSKN